MTPYHSVPVAQVGAASGGSSACGGRDLVACTEHIYTLNNHNGNPPGTNYAYNEVHLNLAAGLASVASGLPFVQLVQRTVFDRTENGMPATFYTNQEAPAAGAGLRSTPRDYAAFLRAYYTHQLLPAALRTEMETDQYPAATRTAFGACDPREGEGGGG